MPAQPDQGRRYTKCWKMAKARASACETGEAVALVAVDGHIDAELVRQPEALPGVERVKPLRF